MVRGPVRGTIRVGTNAVNDREEVIGMATTTTDDREEVVGTTPEAMREQSLRQLKKRRDFNIRKPIIEEDLQRKIKHLGGGS